MVKIVKDELTQLMGGEHEINLSDNPLLSYYLVYKDLVKQHLEESLLIILKEERKNPLLVACDVYRPAAIDQSSYWAIKLMLMYTQRRK